MTVHRLQRGSSVQLSPACVWCYSEEEGAWTDLIGQEALLASHAVYTPISFHPHYAHLSDHLHLRAEFFRITNISSNLINKTMISTGIVSCCSARFNWLVKPHLLTCPSSLHLSIIIIITRLKILSPTGALYAYHLL